MIECIQKELVLQKHYLQNQKIGSIYFGGGTPSLINSIFIEDTLNTIHQNFIVEPEAEITIEANPDDLNQEKLLSLKKAGINRLSIGIQSFHDSVLQWMNRVHSAEEAITCIRLAQSCGIHNISVDLIYGVPEQDDKAWKYNLELAISFGVPHISSYALTVEPRTHLNYAISKKIIRAPQDLQAERQFHIMRKLLQQDGFIHYEISNFAQPGMFSKHNSSYWSGAHYLGIGPSAHSFNGISRQWNISNNSLYIQQIENHIMTPEVEILTDVQQANEMIMTALRTHTGLNLEKFRIQFGEGYFNQLKKNMAITNKEFLQIINAHLIITDTGKFLSDGIISNLFLDDLSG